VEIVTSPKDLPAVIPRSNNPKWRGLGITPGGRR
jgi:hypothetical protein